ncbi:protein PRRC2C-like [Pollicipes pollicipes]|uniref:protein PRRC2C-like n=1 Tax=Pollicipes pollicipes TaxID=41117 RepID=UPI001884C248|nr:protein PRRC2C-like [Pollicipes pollicipes]
MADRERVATAEEAAPPAPATSRDKRPPRDETEERAPAGRGGYVPRGEPSRRGRGGYEGGRGGYEGGRYREGGRGRREYRSQRTYPPADEQNGDGKAVKWSNRYDQVPPRFQRHRDEQEGGAGRGRGAYRGRGARGGGGRVGGAAPSTASNEQSVAEPGAGRPTYAKQTSEQTNEDGEWETASESSNPDGRRASRTATNKENRGGGGSGGGRKTFSGQRPAEQQRRERRGGGETGRRGGSSAPLAAGDKPGKVADVAGTTVGRVDEIKLSDAAGAQQALSDVSSKKAAGAEKATEKNKNGFENYDLNSGSVVIVDDHPEVSEDQFQEAEGFQEVLSKKTAKERQKALLEEQLKAQKREERAARRAAEREVGVARGKQYERSRQSKLPPRLAKQRENSRLQKQSAEPLPAATSLVNALPEADADSSVGLFGIKGSIPAPVPAVNAWDKPITATLRGGPGSAHLSSVDPAAPSQLFDAGDVSAVAGFASDRKSGLDAASFDGASVPTKTMIFENTNFKNSGSAPKLAATHRADAGKQMEAEKRSKPGPIELPLMFKNDDTREMKLEFTFDSDLPLLAEKAMVTQPASHAAAAMSPGTADLNMKIASVKKVWDTPAVPVLADHHAEDLVSSGGGGGGAAAAVAASAGADPTADKEAPAVADCRRRRWAASRPSRRLRPVCCSARASQLQSQTPGLYQPFQLETAAPLMGQRQPSQYSQFAYGVGNNSYSQQSLLMQTPPPNHGPTAKPSAPYHQQSLQFVQYDPTLLSQGLSPHMLGSQLLPRQQPVTPTSSFYSGTQTSAYFQGTGSVQQPAGQVQSFGLQGGFNSLGQSTQNMSLGMQQLRAAAGLQNTAWKTENVRNLMTSGLNSSLMAGSRAQGPGLHPLSPKPAGPPGAVVQ